MDALQIIFLVVSMLMVVAAFNVVTTDNLVHAALWLIGTFFGMAVIFALLEAGFFAAVQVVVYIGAIAILIIFAIMLTRKVMSENIPQTNRLWPIAGLMAMVMFFAITISLSTFPFNVPNELALMPTDDLKTLGFALVDPNQYAAPLMMVGVLLLAGMVGAITVARDDEQAP